MKAVQKYGSAYPGAAPSKSSQRLPGRKTIPGNDGPVSETSAPLALPHERDQTIDRAGGAVPSAQIEQAYQDIKGGLSDTDRSPEVHRTYQKQMI